MACNCPSCPSALAHCFPATTSMWISQGSKVIFRLRMTQFCCTCALLTIHGKFYFSWPASRSCGSWNKMLISGCSNRLNELIPEHKKEGISWDSFWAEFRFCALIFRWGFVTKISYVLICLHMLRVIMWCFQFWQLGDNFWQLGYDVITPYVTH